MEDKKSGFSSARFAYGRRNAIRAIMLHRCGGECFTDDSEIFADLVIPFIVEAATLHKGHSPYEDALKWFRREMPEFLATRGDDCIHALVADALERRGRAADMDRGSRTFVVWLPKMDEIVQTLRPTRAEIAELKLRGWGCIDPMSEAERREADRFRKKASRQSQGATPREESLSALKPWIAEGISRATWFRRKKNSGSETASSGPCEATYGADALVSRSEPVTVVGPPAAVTTITPSLSLSETGYAGRNLVLTPAEVAGVLKKHPVLNDNLPQHFDAVDAKMSKTAVEYRLRVRKNLLRDEAHSALRGRRMVA